MAQGGSRWESPGGTLETKRCSIGSRPSIDRGPVCKLCREARVRADAASSRPPTLHGFGPALRACAGVAFMQEASRRASVYVRFAPVAHRPRRFAPSRWAFDDDGASGGLRASTDLLNRGGASKAAARLLAHLLGTASGQFEREEERGGESRLTTVGCHAAG